MISVMPMPVPSTVLYIRCVAKTYSPTCTYRGIEWSLQALASMRAVGLFLQERAVIKYGLRAANTLKIQMASRDHFVTFLRGIYNRSLFIKKKRLAPSNLAVTPFNQSQQFTAKCVLFTWCQTASLSCSWASLRYTSWTLKEIQSFLIRHYEHITGRSLKLPDFQVLWYGTWGFWLYYILGLGNMNNAAFSLTSISSFGFDDWQTDWLKKI